MPPNQTSKSRVRSFRLDHATDANLAELARRTGQQETRLVKEAINQRLASMDTAAREDFDLLTEVESQRGRSGAPMYPSAMVSADDLRARIDSHMEEVSVLLDNLDARDSGSANDAAFLIERAANIWLANRTKRAKK